MAAVITPDRKKGKKEEKQQLFSNSIFKIFETAREFHFEILFGKGKPFAPETLGGRQAYDTKVCTFE